jgi:hypothetical protein
MIIVVLLVCLFVRAYTCRQLLTTSQNLNFDTTGASLSCFCMGLDKQAPSCISIQ